jgi:hypothetical protein
MDEATELARSLRARVGPADIGLADATLAFVLGMGFVATWAPDTSEQGLQTSEELLEICARIGDLEREVQTRSWRVSILCELDDLPAAGREAKVYAELAARLRQPRVQFYVPLHAGMTAILEGRYADV